jgi:hypothetical protein
MVIPLKDANVPDKVRKALADNDYRIHPHALLRMNERKVILTEITYILKNGYQEVSKDEFDHKFQNWKYSIRGNTLDERDLRVVVKLAGKMMIITIVDKDN